MPGSANSPLFYKDSLILEALLKCLDDLSEPQYRNKLKKTLLGLLGCQHAHINYIDHPDNSIRGDPPVPAWCARLESNQHGIAYEASSLTVRIRAHNTSNFKDRNDNKKARGRLPSGFGRCPILILLH